MLQVDIELLAVVLVEFDQQTQAGGVRAQGVVGAAQGGQPRIPSEVGLDHDPRRGAGLTLAQSGQVGLHRRLVEQVGRDLVGDAASMQLPGQDGMDGFQERGLADLVVAHDQIHVGIEGQLQVAERLEVLDDDAFDRHGSPL